MIMKVNDNEFILIKSEDGCQFPGVIYFSREKTKRIIIFIHGTGGNFFKLKYYDEIKKQINNNNIDFMVVNNRGSEQFFNVHRELNNCSESFKGGAIFENFSESNLDVEAAVLYAKEREYTDICLVGESLGTSKIMYYILTKGSSEINKIILLSPVDMINRFRSKVANRYEEIIALSENLIKAKKPYEMVTDDSSAIKVYSTMRVDSMADIFKLENNRKSDTLNYNGNISIIIGENDHCNKEWGVEHLKNKMKQNFDSSKLQINTISNADHLFKNCETELSKVLIESYLKM